MATYDTNYISENGDNSEQATNLPEERLTSHEALAGDGNRDTLKKPETPSEESSTPEREAPTPLDARKRRAAKADEPNKRTRNTIRKEPASTEEIAEPVSIALARNEAPQRTSGLGEDETALMELEAQGFTEDEALRLITVSGRLATSREAREAEATLRRLRFTRWLIERGILDEFSA